VAVFSLFTSPEDLLALQSSMRDLIPDRAADVVLDPLENLVEGRGAGAGGLAIAGVLAGLWAATSAAVTLIKALSRAYDVPETRKFVGQRVTALAITVALLVALAGIVLLLVAGAPIQEALLPPQLGAVGSALLTAARVAGALVLLVLLFAFVYWIGPNRERPEWVWMSPGAVVGVVGWLLVSGGFTLYVRNFGNYDATYGALGGVVVLLVWLQLSMLLLLFGAEFNAEIERSRARRVAIDEGVGFAPEEPVEAQSLGEGDPGALAALTPPPPPRSPRPPPGLEETEPSGALAARGVRTAGSDGAAPSRAVAGVGAAAAAATALVAVVRHRRKRR
jgi:membrane protein